MLAQLSMHDINGYIPKQVVRNKKRVYSLSLVRLFDVFKTVKRPTRFRLKGCIKHFERLDFG